MTGARNTAVGPLPDELREFNQLKGAYPSIFAIALVAAEVIVGVWIVIDDKFHERPIDQDAADFLVFAGYLLVFAAMWVVYFLSTRDDFNVRTLRKLLIMTSRLWVANDSDDVRDVQNEKSTRTLTMVAMLTSAAILELVVVSRLYNTWPEPTASRKLLLGLATISVLVAIISFVISADSLDAMFNCFGKRADQASRERVPKILIRHFYQTTIHPRYAGLVGLLLGAVFIVAFHEIWIASLALGLIMLIGSPHWFPRIRRHPYKLDLWALVPIWLIVLLLPLLVHYGPLPSRPSWCLSTPPPSAATTSPTSEACSSTTSPRPSSPASTA